MKNHIYKNTDINEGIWLDEQTAIIVGLASEKSAPTIKKIMSNVEDFHPKGGSRSRVPWGPKEVVSEQKYLNRKKNQLKKYYHSIIAELKGDSGLYILGPAQAKYELLKNIKEQRRLKFDTIELETLPRITDRQLVAKVRTHFKG